MLLRIISWIAIPGMMGVVGLCAYWQVRPYALPEGADVTVLGPLLEPGEPLEFAVLSCEGFLLNESITRVLADGSIYSLAYRSQVDDEPGCHNLVIAIPLPKEAMLGQHHLTITAEYRPNPIRIVIHRYPSRSFTVMRRR